MEGSFFKILKYAKAVLIVAVVLNAGFFAIVFAQTTPDTSTPGQTLTVQRLVQVVTTLACFFADILLILMFVVFIYYAIRYATSGGNPDAYSSAKKGLLWAFVGAIIILGTYTIIATVANAVGSNFQVIPINCSGS